MDNTNVKVGNKRWFIALLLALCYTVLFMDRSNLSMAGSSMMKDFNWSSSEFGLVSTAFFFGYAISQMPGGRLADRYGGGKIVIIGAMFWSVFVFITPFGYTLGLMIFIRLLMGMGEGLALPSIYSILAKWFPKHESGKATGFVQAGCPLGIAITMPIATAIIVRLGWKAVFYIFAFLAPIWCLIWWKFGKDRPEQSNISPEELAYIKSGSEEGKNEKSSGPTLLSKKQILSTKSIWVCTLSYFCANYLFFLFMTWLPNYFVIGRGIDIHDSAFLAMLPYIVGVFSYPLGGYFADKASNKFGQNIGRKMFPMIGLAVAGAFLILGSQAPNALMASILISVSNGFLSLTMGSYFSMPVVFSQQNAGMITGMFTTMGTIAGIIAPTATGVIIDFTGAYETALYVGAIIALIGALILLFTKVKPILEEKNIEESVVGETIS